MGLSIRFHEKLWIVWSLCVLTVLALGTLAYVWLSVPRPAASGWEDGFVILTESLGQEEGNRWHPAHYERAGIGSRLQAIGWWPTPEG